MRKIKGGGELSEGKREGGSHGTGRMKRFWQQKTTNREIARGNTFYYGHQVTAYLTLPFSKPVSLPKGKRKGSCLTYRTTRRKKKKGNTHLTQTTMTPFGCLDTWGNLGWAVQVKRSKKKKDKARIKKQKKGFKGKRFSAGGEKKILRVRLPSRVRQKTKQQQRERRERAEPKKGAVSSVGNDGLEKWKQGAGGVQGVGKCLFDGVHSESEPQPPSAVKRK